MSGNIVDWEKMYRMIDKTVKKFVFSNRIVRFILKNYWVLGIV